MSTINLKDLGKVESRITTYYESMHDDFCRKIEFEEKKYPLSDREKVFVETIKELLKTLDRSSRRW